MDANKAYTKRTTVKQVKELRYECREGRKTLNQSHHVNGDSIGHVFKDCKVAKRLYSKMPLDQIQLNLDQQTFTMRKERDRLKYRLSQLKEELRTVLVS